MTNKTNLSVRMVGAGGDASRAFTIVELLVVVGTVGLLWLTLVPAFCQSRPVARTTACAANFRQWTVSMNLFAKDHLDWLFSSDPEGGGRYAWDVGTNMCDVLGAYGLTVPKWFCPVRPGELDAANRWANSQFGHPIRSMQELRAYFGSSYPGQLILNHNYWVPRYQNQTVFPTDYSALPPVIVPSWVKGSDPSIYGWPRRLEDRAAAYVPFVSDKCGSGNAGGLAVPSSGTVSYLVSDISPNTAHFTGGRLLGVNAAYVDGHVANRRPAQMRAVYSSGSAYWFY